MLLLVLLVLHPLCHAEVALGYGPVWAAQTSGFSLFDGDAPPLSSTTELPEFGLLTRSARLHGILPGLTTSVLYGDFHWLHRVQSFGIAALDMQTMTFKVSLRLSR